MTLMPLSIVFPSHLQFVEKQEIIIKEFSNQRKKDESKIQKILTELAQLESENGNQQNFRK